MDTETAERVAEWSEWRGTINTRLDAIPGQMQSIADGVNERLADLHQIAVATHAQTLKTNGRVNGHDVDIAEIKTIAQTESTARASSVKTGRYRLTQAVALVGASAAVAEAVAHLFGH